jgi:hypothetical protein
MRLLLVSAIAACGGNPAAPQVDAACGDGACVAPCTAMLTGNVDETVVSQAVCPVLQPGSGNSEGHTMIDFLVPSQLLATELAVRIDLGPLATLGTYTSETTTIWSAIAIQPKPMHGTCIFNAGNLAVPAGYFALDVGSLTASTGHGSLAVTMFVLPFTDELGSQTDCGPITTEDLQLMF